MSGLDVAGVALASVQICGKLASELYEIIKAVHGATSEARKTQNALVSLRTRLEKVRLLFKTTTAQDVEEESFRNSIIEILENINEELRDLEGKLRLGKILSSKTYIGKAWDQLAIKLDDGEIKNIQTRIAGHEKNLQTHFELMSLSLNWKTQRDLTEFNNNIVALMKTVLGDAKNNERLYRMELAESCTSRTIGHEEAPSSTYCGSIVGNEPGPKYLTAIERWLRSIDSDPSSNQLLQQDVKPYPSAIDEDYLGSLGTTSTFISEGSPRITTPIPDPDAPRNHAWCKEQGFNINSLRFGYDQINDMVSDQLKGFSPIHQAIIQGANDILESMLSSHGYNLEVKLETRNDNATPLLLACSKRNATALRLLLNKGALRNTTDNTGKTGLHRCQSSAPGGKNIACLLLDSDDTGSLDVDARDQYGMTAVHMAARMGDIEMLEYLLGEKHADVNLRQPDGSTPLILALKHTKTHPKRLDVVFTLLQCGADATLQNNKKETAKDIAKLTKVDGDKNVLELLKAYETINRISRTNRQSRGSRVSSQQNVHTSRN